MVWSWASFYFHFISIDDVIIGVVDVVGGVSDGVAVAQVASATDAADLSEVIENCPNDFYRGAWLFANPNSFALTEVFQNNHQIIVDCELI